MATITSVSHNSYKNTPRRSYISVAPFNDAFFTYTTSVNSSFVTIGTLTAVTGATAANCPKGRVLRENGRKLYPSANPGVSTYLVGVFDDKTFFNGFIDPNSPLFAPFNTDKPVYLDNGVNGGNGGLAPGGLVNGLLVQNRTSYTLDSTTPVTLTTAELLGGILTHTPSAAATVNLPSTAAIVSALGGVVGASADLIYLNTSGANTATLTRADTDTDFITSAGAPATSFTIPVSTLTRFLVVVTGTTAAPTITIYRV
jgi:hypothetical protein